MLNLIPLLGPILDRLVDRIPDGNARARAKEEAEKQLLGVFSEASKAQSEINKIEAAHKSLFVAGWRPSIGWTCSATLAWTFVGQPMAAYALSLYDPSIPVPPALQTEFLLELVMAMLGISGLRTYEKLKGVAREK
jgi:hypothetical protein